MCVTTSTIFTYDGANQKWFNYSVFRYFRQAWQCRDETGMRRGRTVKQFDILHLLIWQSRMSNRNSLFLFLLKTEARFLAGMVLLRLQMHELFDLHYAPWHTQTWSSLICLSSFRLCVRFMSTFWVLANSDGSTSVIFLHGWQKSAVVTFSLFLQWNPFFHGYHVFEIKFWPVLPYCHMCGVTASVQSKVSSIHPVYCWWFEEYSGTTFYNVVRVTMRLTQDLVL